VQTSTKSGSVSPGKAAEPSDIDDMFKNYAGPKATQQTMETAEESFRVKYQDPAAEKEKQRLLAGFRGNASDRDSQHATRSRAR
jgi:hypothetical protein